MRTFVERREVPSFRATAEALGCLARRRVAILERGRVRIVDRRGREEALLSFSPEEAATALAVSARGDLVAVGHASGVVTVFRVP